MSFKQHRLSLCTQVAWPGSWDGWPLIWQSGQTCVRAVARVTTISDAVDDVRSKVRLTPSTLTPLPSLDFRRATTKKAIFVLRPQFV